MSYENRFWRMVAMNRDDLERRAPDGYAPRVDVYLAGSPEPLAISVVESRRDDSWVLFHVYGGTSPEPDPGDRYIFARQEAVTKVELCYVRKTEAAIGFRVEERADQL